MRGWYAFGVRHRLETADPAVRLDPDTVETRCLLEAADPGTEGWLLFRDVLWRGEVTDEPHVASLLAERLGHPVETVDFRGFHVDDDYRLALESAIANDLSLFRADDVAEVISKYVGSRLEVEH